MDKTVKCVLLLGLFGLAQGATISGTIETNVGWRIYVAWTRNDATDVLKNVTVTRNENEVLFLYEPVTHGETFFNTTFVNSDSISYISCEHGVVPIGGRCNITVIGNGPLTDATYRAVNVWITTTGSRKETGEETIIAKASPAAIKRIQVTGQRDNFNCTSSGVPAPALVWTLEKDNSQVLAESNGTLWNNVTKYYDSWSVFKPTNISNGVWVVCTPRQVNRKGEVTIRDPNKVLINSAHQFGASIVSAAVLLAIALNTYSVSL